VLVERSPQHLTHLLDIFFAVMLFSKELRSNLISKLGSRNRYHASLPILMIDHHAILNYK